MRTYELVMDNYTNRCISRATGVKQPTFHFTSASLDDSFDLRDLLASTNFEWFGNLGLIPWHGSWAIDFDPHPQTLTSMGNFLREVKFFSRTYLTDSGDDLDVDFKFNVPVMVTDVPEDELLVFDPPVRSFCQVLLERDEDLNIDRIYPL